MLDHFRMFARYNRWANQRIYDAAEPISETKRTADRGAFFKSLHGTLNHILVADRVWMDRLEGEPDEFMKSYFLDTVTEPKWNRLRAARDAMDARIASYINALTEDDIHKPMSYSDSKRVLHTNTPADVLPHFFNHQTHHRGQAHDLIQQITGEAPSLDMILFSRTDEG